MVEAVIRDFGHVDILVNNAGLASRGQSVADTDPQELERVVPTTRLLELGYLDATEVLPLR